MMNFLTQAMSETFQGTNNRIKRNVRTQSVPSTSYNNGKESYGPNTNQLMPYFLNWNSKQVLIVPARAQTFITLHNIFYNHTSRSM